MEGLVLESLHRPGNHRKKPGLLRYGTTARLACTPITKGK
jgi:hypothetical protein